MPQWFFTLSLGLFGLLFGSFANVVIWRLPRGESLVQPGSHCLVCATPIAWYDNVPLLSWIALRGRCRACGAPIPVRYPLVEAASGALFALSAVRFGVNLQAVFACALLWCLLVLALIDVEHFRLPNPIVGSLAAIGCAGAVVAHLSSASLVPLFAHGSTGALSHPLAASLAGALVAGGGAFALAEGYALVRKRQGFGMGDVKLLGALGVWLGLYALMAFALASVAGTLYALGRALSTEEPLGQARLPFGAFLAAGAATTVFVGPELLSAYLRAVGLL